MFSHEGPSRSPAMNGVLAGSLALVAGYVNSGGFVLLRSFTSHMTGSVSRVGEQLAVGEPTAAAFAALLVGAFFLGAFSASLILESRLLVRTSPTYGAAFVVEALLLAAFVVVAGRAGPLPPRVVEGAAALLCAAMGMQNSLVTRLSGAVVRTTHVTGVVTDLGIEAARWWRFALSRLRAPSLPAAASGPPERPTPVRALLLATILVAFSTGAFAGAVVTARASRWSMLLPVAAILAAAVYALYEPARRRDG